MTNTMRATRCRPAVVPAILCAACAASAALAAEPPAANDSRPDKTEIRLTGTDLSAWREPTGDWMVVGAVTVDSEDATRLVGDPRKEVSATNQVLLNGTAGRTSNLHSKHEHGDVRAHIEFMVPKGSNSGVYFQSRYEVQILDSWGKENVNYGDCGGIYQRWKDGKGFEGHAPRENASKPPGQWQAFDVVFRAPRFDEEGRKVENAQFIRVVHNGVLVHEKVTLSGPTRAATFHDERPTGPLMLQGDHGPVAYRNIRLTPIDTDRWVGDE